MVGQAFLLVVGFMKKCMHEKNSRDKQECLSYRRDRFISLLSEGLAFEGCSK